MNDKPMAFSCRNFRRPLAWLRAPLRASDNHQDTFAAAENAFRYEWVTLQAKSVDHRWSIVRCTLSQLPASIMWYPRRSGTKRFSFVFASCFIIWQTLPEHLNMWIKAYLPYCTRWWHSSCIRKAGFTPSSWPSILSCVSFAKQSKFFVPTLVIQKFSFGSFNVAVKTFTWLLPWADAVPPNRTRHYDF